MRRGRLTSNADQLRFTVPMPNVPILSPIEKWWECPSCHLQAKTVERRPHTEMHQCRALGGLLTPMVEVRTNEGIRRGTVRHRLIEREDYVGREVGLRFVGGTAVSAVHTERADGSHDTAVYAPAATAGADVLHDLKGTH